MATRYYTGVGSRQTPKDILDVMRSISIKLESLNFILRSGGADGADYAFERAINKGKKQIFYAKHCNSEAMKIAEKYHPAWHLLNPYVKKLHGRNAMQVLGQDLNTPSEVLICWTPDGCIAHRDRTIETGGTGTAISIADAYNVPIQNLHCKETLDSYIKWLAK